MENILGADTKENEIDEAENMKSNSVVHPKYYNTGKIEVIDFILDQKLNFLLGSAVKYICRAGKKDPSTTIEDLKKAINCLEIQIKADE